MNRFVDRILDVILVGLIASVVWLLCYACAHTRGDTVTVEQFLRFHAIPPQDHDFVQGRCAIFCHRADRPSGQCYRSPTTEVLGVGLCTWHAN